MNEVVKQYFWIRKRNPGMTPAEAWAGAMQVTSFFASFNKLYGDWTP